MRKNPSFIILSDSGRRVSQFRVPTSAILILVLAGILGALATGYFLYHYNDLRRAAGRSGVLAQTIDDQQAEILQQRRQIQLFAKKIDTLKGNLSRLNRFEKKIRVIANLENTSDEENIFGVGGAASEDLDPRIALTERHEHLMREMHQQINALDAASVRQEDRFDTLLDKLEGQRNLLASTPAIQPADGWVTSRFGYRTSPFTDRKEFHKGLDIANRKGTPILAAAAGVISFVGKKSHMGKVVVIDHGHGMVTRYAHLSETLKKRGERVGRGDVIAQMGNSGRSTGPHLHYEVLLNGVHVNPSNFILD